MIRTVRVSSRARKDLRSVPAYLADKLAAWSKLVAEYGLEEVRKRRGYRDESLHGNRNHQRSIRLNDAYRAIYEIQSDGAVEFVSVEEVNKHDYR